MINTWRSGDASSVGGKEIVSLIGEASADLRLLEKGDAIVCTPTQVRSIRNCEEHVLTFPVTAGCFV